LLFVFIAAEQFVDQPPYLLGLVGEATVGSCISVQVAPIAASRPGSAAITVLWADVA